jgi:hypothetical protein
MSFYQKGKISAYQAYLKANDKKKFQPQMEKELAMEKVDKFQAAFG